MQGVGQVHWLKIAALQLPRDVAPQPGLCLNSNLTLHNSPQLYLFLALHFYRSIYRISKWMH